jgi:hypothetical protein
MVDAHNTTGVEIESFTQHEVLLRPYFPIAHSS